MSFHASLPEAHLALAALATALQQEQSALQSRDVIALDAAVAAKLAPLAQLQAIAAQWDQWRGNQPLEAYADDQGDGDEWAAIAEQLQQLRQQNAVNGAAIHLKRQATHRALACLRGVEATTPGYGPSSLGRR